MGDDSFDCRADLVNLFVEFLFPVDEVAVRGFLIGATGNRKPSFGEEWARHSDRARTGSPWKSPKRAMGDREASHDRLGAGLRPQRRPWGQVLAFSLPEHAVD